MSSSVSCLVYDLDGTLVDTVANITAAVNRERVKRQLPIMAISEVSPCIGGGSKVLIERAMFGINMGGAALGWAVLSGTVDFDEVYQSFMAGYIADPLNGARVYDGVHDALNYFREVGIPQFVLTNKPHHVAVALLTELGLDSYFEIMLGPDGEFQGKAVKPKPDPGTLNAVIDWLGVTKSGVWMIGDGEPDVRVAQAAGVHSLAVQGGFYPEDMLTRLSPPPEKLCETFREAFEFLKKQHEVSLRA